MRLVLAQPMLGDETRQERAVDPPRHVVTRRYGWKGAGVVVEADGVVKPAVSVVISRKRRMPSGLSLDHQAGPSFSAG